jgi:hypothetical protein
MLWHALVHMQERSLNEINTNVAPRGRYKWPKGLFRTHFRDKRYNLLADPINQIRIHNVHHKNRGYGRSSERT